MAATFEQMQDFIELRANNETLVSQSDELQEDLLDFVKFRLEYTNTLMDDWWKLDHEERVRCQQLVLPGGISFNSQKKVGTSQISPIYTLQLNKKDLRFERKSLMVVLLDQNLHLLVEEVNRWRELLGGKFKAYKNGVT